MAIEDLDSKQELGRWIVEFLEGEPLPISAVDGLEQMVSPGQWNTLALLNSWTDVGSGALGAKWRSIPGQGIQLGGLIEGGGSGTVVAELPVAFHPKETLAFDAGNASGGEAEFLLNSAGELTYLGEGQSYVSLTSVIFWAGS